VRKTGRQKPQSEKTFEESDAQIVPTCKKSTNSRVTPEESMEGRGAANGKSASRNTLRAQDRQSVLTKLERIGQRAKEIRWPVDQRWEPGAGNPLAGFCPGGGPKGPSLPGRKVLSLMIQNCTRGIRTDRSLNNLDGAPASSRRSAGFQPAGLDRHRRRAGGVPPAGSRRSMGRRIALVAPFAPGP